MKKQKNPSYDRLLFRLHGLMVSTDHNDYDKLNFKRNQFYEELFQ